MPTYRLDLGYDGGGFHGFARNRGVRTVQGDLEAALAKVARQSVDTTVAGRTDAGVHAAGQVVSFETEAALDVDRAVRSLRSMLGPEIAVRDLSVAGSGFNARFSALSRRYRYSVETAPVLDPLARSAVWHVGAPLDLAAMNSAAAAFVGTRDFASLCRAQEGKTTERTVISAGWASEGTLNVFEVVAVAFCHQMVRSMVALCIEVGRGRVDSAAVPGILEQRDRNAARGAAPPHGLILIEVEYPPVSEGTSASRRRP